MVSPQGGHHSSDAKWCSRHHAAKEQWSNRPQLNRKDNHIILTLKRQFIMTKETKENVQIVSAIAMLIGGFLLAVAAIHRTAHRTNPRVCPGCIRRVSYLRRVYLRCHYLHTD